MPEKVLVFSRFPKAQLQRFGERYELLNAAGKPPNEVFSAPELAGIRAMITAGGTRLGAEALDMLPKLEAIVCYGTGYDGVDLAAVAKRKIALGHSPGANAASVADIAVTLMLAATRRLLAADDYVRSSSWAAAKPSPMMRPQAGMLGRRIGVYGMGEIGRKIAVRVASFETEVGYFSRSRHDVPYRYFPSLEALAEWCSVLMIAVRAGSDTHHVVDANILNKLGKDGYVVNIARGSVIDHVPARTERYVVLIRRGAAAFCRGSLTEYKVPRAVEIRDTLPMSAVGKILYRVLRDEHAASLQKS